MKAIALVLAVIVPAMSFALDVTKSGGYQTGYNKELREDIFSSLSVSYSDQNNSGVIDLGEKRLVGKRNGMKISAYDMMNPEEFFYYIVDLKPLRGDYRGTPSVILKQEGASTTMCNEKYNALLTAIRGDGTKETFCATLK